MDKNNKSFQLRKSKKQTNKNNKLAMLNYMGNIEIILPEMANVSTVASDIIIQKKKIFIQNIESFFVTI